MPESKFSKPTDSAEVIKLESAIIYADWRQGAAYAGCGAGFEVVTVFVGNGATIEISGKSEKGKKLGKIKGTMEANRYVGSFDIPGDIEPGDQISFEAKLSANNIDGESSAIPVCPAPVVTNMKWSAQEAKRGDRLTLSGDVDKVPGGTEAEIIIYEYDQDGAHDKVAAIPVIIKDMKFEAQWEYEYHEDTDDIPTKEEMEKHGGKYHPPEYFFVLVINESRFGTDQKSGLLQFKDWIELKLINHTGKEKYVLYLPDGSTEKGAFDDNGMMRFEKTLPGKYRVEVETEDDRSLTYDVSSGKSHALDCRRRYYFLDVGKWGRSSDGTVHTEFGIVSENLILLCEWKRARMPNRASPKHVPDNVRKILKGMVDTSPDGRGFIRDWLEDPQPFTEPGEVFVFLPDLHLHLYKGYEFDSFTEPNSEKQSESGNPGEKQEWVSLEGELAKLLELCKKNSKKFVQIGDCFDIWKSQDMLIDDLLRLELDIKAKPALSIPKNALNYPSEFMECLGMEWDSALDGKDLAGIKAKILDQKMVMKATVRTYDKIFPGGKIPEEFYWLHGNHDNMLENPYYVDHCWDERLDGYGIDRESYMIPDCRHRPVLWNGGKKKCIWAEHGHRCDSVNNDEDFHKGLFSGYFLTRNLADTAAEKGYYWTLHKLKMEHNAQIKRLRELKKDEPNVRVVVMGHTHICLLEDESDRLSEDAENTEDKLAGGSPGFR